MIKRIIAAMLCVIFMTGCEKKPEPETGGGGHLFTACLYGNPVLDPQIANDTSSHTVIANLFSGLLKTDASGGIVCDNAESYSISPDGLVYTFILRPDCYWLYDINRNSKADSGEFWSVTADDYVFAFRRLFSPETNAADAEDFTCIIGAKDMLAGYGGNLGVRAADSFKLEFCLEYPNADFLILLTKSAAKPCYEEFFLSTKGRYGLDDKSVMSNGGFFVTEWFYDPYGNRNTLYMRRSAVNSEGSTVYPSYVCFNIEREQESIKKQFKSGQLDCMPSLIYDSGYVKSKYYYESYMTVTLGLIYNTNDDIYSNKNMRKAIACAINRDALSKEKNDVKAAYGLIPDGISLLGRSYRELSGDRSFDCYSEENALQYFYNAKKELGIESFSAVKILANTEHINTECFHAVSQQLQEILGYYIGIEEVSPKDYYSRLNEGDYSIALYPVTADHNSGVSFLKELCGSEYFDVSSDVMQQLSMLDSVADYSDYVELFSGLERSIIEEHCFTPLFYKNTYLINKKGCRDIIYNPFSGAIDFRVARYINN